MRYTLKDDEYWVKSDNREKAIQKLGQLEDIEEELGIDLVTLFKVLKNGVYYKNEFGEIVRGYPRYESDVEEYVIGGVRDYTFLKDYGKTWALTKEELE